MIPNAKKENKIDESTNYNNNKKKTEKRKKKKEQGEGEGGVYKHTRSRGSQLDKH